MYLENVLKNMFENQFFCSEEIDIMKNQKIYRKVFISRSFCYVEWKRIETHADFLLKFIQRIHCNYLIS